MFFDFSGSPPTCTAEIKLFRVVSAGHRYSIILILRNIGVWWQTQHNNGLRVAWMKFVAHKSRQCFLKVKKSTNFLDLANDLLDEANEPAGVDVSIRIHQASKNWNLTPFTYFFYTSQFFVNQKIIDTFHADGKTKSEFNEAKSVWMKWVHIIVVIVAAKSEKKKFDVTEAASNATMLTTSRSMTQWSGQPLSNERNNDCMCQCPIIEFNSPDPIPPSPSPNAHRCWNLTQKRRLIDRNPKCCCELARWGWDWMRTNTLLFFLFRRSISSVDQL